MGERRVLGIEPEVSSSGTNINLCRPPFTPNVLEYVWHEIYL